MNTLYKWIAITLLLFSIGFNLWLYSVELSTTVDPNDNAFQFALVDRTNQMWDYASRVCPKNLAFSICHLALLTDHWVPNWAQGYNLPYYYSHVPQILIVASWRLLHSFIGLFVYYHWIFYLLLCFFPLSMFLAFRILKFPWLTAGIAALFASQISTDGLYGIDQASFLWRGWGLSSQLFALIWLPLAIASIIQFVKNKFSIYHLAFSIVFLTATTAGHLGIGMMAFLAIPVVCLTPGMIGIFKHQGKKEIIDALITGIKQTIAIAIPPILILSYWIVPAFFNNQYHNISLWDPVWKFNSYGAKDVITKFVGGELFDFGRLPVFTVLVVMGFLTALPRLPHLSFLFPFFLILFFGRTTWGGLLDLIPGMSEFHQHRFIVGVHLAGLFLAPVGIEWIISRFRFPIKFIMIIIFIIIISPQTIKYASYNTTLIKQANDEYAKTKSDADGLVSTLRTLESQAPGRVYALRAKEGGDFKIASTPYYMYLSTNGLPTVMWLPETWSPNSDTEQFFSEDNPVHYDLYNIRYVAAPRDKKPPTGKPSFWKQIAEAESWKLYEVATDGSITVGTAPSVVFSKKTDIINLVHLWMHSGYPKQHIFPELRLRPALPAGSDSATPRDSLPHFTMLDPVTYQTPDTIKHILFSEPPVYISNLSSLSDLAKITSQSSDTDMVFKATVEIEKNCPQCVIILKQTYHTSWRALVNGKSVKPISVFPFFTAIRLEDPGRYDIVFSYTPKSLMPLLTEPKK